LHFRKPLHDKISFTGSSSERQAPTRRDLKRTEAQRGVLSGYHTGNINIYPFLMFESTLKVSVGVNK